MRLTVQRRLAADIFKRSPKKVWFDEDDLEEIKESITKADIKVMISQGAIRIKPTVGVSRGRARKIKTQKAKGLRSGHGSRKGKRTARLPKKQAWMTKIRIQRSFLKELRDKELINKSNYQMLYLRSKGGFFRSKRHIKLYIDEQKLVVSKK